MTIAGKSLAALALVWAAGVMPAGAQGKHDSAPGQSKKHSNAGAAAAATVSPATATSSTSAPSTSANPLLYYGSWLDDASVMAPGAVWMGASTSYWKADSARQVDAPVIMGALGVVPRIQLGGSIPVYHFRDDTGAAGSGVGTMSMYGKVMLIDPAVKGRVGVALAPLVEMAPGADQGFGWALPVNVEARADRFRMYGSAGYFSRGSVFGTVAVEVPAGQRSAVTASLGESRSRGSQQTTAGLTFSFFPASTTGLFVSVGHSSAAEALANGGLSIGGGVAVTLQPHRP
jgi:hypothetical protein